MLHICYFIISTPLYFYSHTAEVRKGLRLTEKLDMAA